MLSYHPHSPTYSDTPTYYKASGYSSVEWRTDALSAVDWLGNTFRVGERVMYCIAAGRGQMMALGEVKQIRTREVNYRDWVDDTKTGKAGEWVTKTRTEIEVQVITEKTSGHWNNRERSKPAWVNPMNITSLENLPTPKEK